MNNLRISVTSLDSWRYTMSHEDKDVDELMAQLRGQFVQNQAMRAGSAFHKALERAQEGLMLSLEADGYRFTVERNIELALPVIRELKLEATIPIDHNLTVTLVGKVDGKHGRTVYDHKTTRRYEAEYLLDTYQWRYYLQAADADKFTWNVFIINEGRWFTDFTGTKINEYQVKDFQQLSQYRYPGMGQDCKRSLIDFLDFLGVSRMTFPKQDCRLAELLKANQ